MARRGLAAAFQWTEARLDAAFGARHNPLHQLGALGFFYYWVVAVTGIYLYVFFDTGTTEAYDSVEYLTVEQWYLGGVMRSLHRYASDGMVLMMAVHIVREFAFGRFRGPRWFTWTTGVPVAGFVLAAGITGYWLVWDTLAQYVAIATSEWFDWLGIFGERIARNFLTPASLDDRFFTLLMFIHIVVPLFLLLVLWIHLLRVTRPAINPSRGLAAGTFVMLLALSLAKPAVSHPPADLALVPTALQLDWFYLFPYPLMDATSYGAVWGMTLCVTVVLVALPWLPPRWRAAPAVVHLESCNGCARCADDCPYEAITMRPRSDNLPFEREAAVDPALCTACGICAGACPTAMPFRRRSALVPGIELPDLTIDDLRARCAAASAALPATGKREPRILVFGCRHGAPVEGLASSGDGGVAVVTQPCTAGIPPSFVDYALSRGLADGVVVAGCAEGDCEYRFGPDWTDQRFARRRDPYLRTRVPRDRLAVVWTADGKALRRAVADLKARLADMTTDAPGGDARGAVGGDAPAVAAAASSGPHG